MQCTASLSSRHRQSRQREVIMLSPMPRANPNKPPAEGSGTDNGITQRNTTNYQRCCAGFRVFESGFARPTTVSCRTTFRQYRMESVRRKTNPKEVSTSESSKSSVTKIEGVTASPSVRPNRSMSVKFLDQRVTGPDKRWIQQRTKPSKT